MPQYSEMSDEDAEKYMAEAKPRENETNVDKGPSGLRCALAHVRM